MHKTSTLCWLSLKHVLKSFFRIISLLNTYVISYTLIFFLSVWYKKSSLDTNLQRLITLLPSYLSFGNDNRSNSQEGWAPALNTISKYVVTVQIFNLSVSWLSEHPGERAGFHDAEDNRCSVLFRAGEQRWVQWGYRYRKLDWVWEKSREEKYLAMTWAGISRNSLLHWQVALVASPA